MDFYESFKEYLFSRLEQIEPDLIKSKDCKAANAEIEEAISALDADIAENVRSALYRLHDLYSRFFYAAGIQDGAKMIAADLPAKIIE